MHPSEEAAGGHTDIRHLFLGIFIKGILITGDGFALKLVKIWSSKFFLPKVYGIK